MLFVPITRGFSIWKARAHAREMAAETARRSLGNIVIHSHTNGKAIFFVVIEAVQSVKGGAYSSVS